MYAQIGDIVLDGHYGFTSFKSNDGSNIVEHALIEGKPKVQKIGDNLSKLTIGININRGFVDPETEINKWRKYCFDATPVPFTLGTGQFLGYYLVTSIENNVEQTDGNGGFIQCTLDISLIEFVVEGEENKGAAVFSNNPASVSSVAVTRSLAGQVSGDVRDCSNLSAEMDTNLTIAEKVPAKKDAKFKDTLKKIQQVDKKLSNVYTITSNAFRLVNEAQTLQRKIKTTQTLLKSLKSLLEIKDLDGAKLANRDFQSNMRNIGSLTAPFTKTYVLRKSA